MIRTCPLCDRIHAVDDTHVGLPRVNQIHYFFIMLRVEKAEMVFIPGIELSERPGRDDTQGRRLRIAEGNAELLDSTAHRERRPVLHGRWLT